MLRTAGTILLAIAMAGFGALVPPVARAAAIGDIQACYYCTSNFGSLGVVDAPTFQINNTSVTGTLTNLIFYADIGGATADSFSIGTLAAGASFVLETGVTTDGNSHSGFFASVVGGRDTSESGPNAGTTEFRLTGLLDGVAVDTGIFTPAQTAGPSNDLSITSINFLGGGPSTDGPCSNCFGPTTIATLGVAVPEPSSALLLLCGLVPLVEWRRH